LSDVRVPTTRRRWLINDRSSRTSIGGTHTSGISPTANKRASTITSF
jgi:hypothetical protein